MKAVRVHEYKSDRARPTRAVDGVRTLTLAGFAAREYASKSPGATDDMGRADADTFLASSSRLPMNPFCTSARCTLSDCDVCMSTSKKTLSDGSEMTTSCVSPCVVLSFRVSPSQICETLGTYIDSGSGEVEWLRLPSVWPESRPRLVDGTARRPSSLAPSCSSSSAGSA